MFYCFLRSVNPNLARKKLFGINLSYNISEPTLKLMLMHRFRIWNIEVLQKTSNLKVKEEINSNAEVGTIAVAAEPSSS